MAKNFDELRDKIPPDRLAIIKNLTDSIIDELELSRKDDGSYDDGSYDDGSYDEGNDNE